VPRAIPSSRDEERAVNRLGHTEAGRAFEIRVEEGPKGRGLYGAFMQVFAGNQKSFELMLGWVLFFSLFGPRAGARCFSYLASPCSDAQRCGRSAIVV
jgi:hypothetical protein